MRDVFLIAVAVFLVLIPWFEALSFGADSGMAVYGTAIGASVVLAIAVGSSLATWRILSRASKDIRLPGIVLGVITGAALAVPFLQILGPTGGVVVGIVAGLAAFSLQKRMRGPKENRPLATAATTLAAAYFALIVVSLTLTVPSLWGADSGMGKWYGTVDGYLAISIFDAVSYGAFRLDLLLVAVSSLIITGLIIRGKNESAFRDAQTKS